jgi:NADPH:quinone reductase-like Zn-dependent oxidoreductase
MSGVVSAVGSKVTSFTPGDKVWTQTYYKDIRAGCFQEYVVVPAHTVLSIPSTVSFSSAACLGVAALTAGMTLWKWLNVPMASDTSSEEGDDDEEEEQEKKDEWLLIWGGSAVTGQFATQFASQSGVKVITVNSASTAALSKSLGASHVVIRDNKTPEQLVSEIRAATAGNVTRAIDLVGSKTAALTLQAVSQTAKVDFAPLALMSKDTPIPDNVTAHTVEMKQFVLDASNGVYAEALDAMLESGSIVLPEIHLIEGGLEVVEASLDLLKKGDMKGKKMVVHL